jgi:hypothetical protein
MIDNFGDLEDLRVNPFHRYDLANAYYRTLKEARLMIPELVKISDLLQQIELHMLVTGTLPDINAYCQAVAEAWKAYVEYTMSYYWNNTLSAIDNLSTVEDLKNGGIDL